MLKLTKYKLGEKELSLVQGSIADHQGDGMFFLNLSSIKFPELGPILDAIYNKDGAISIWDAIQEYVSLINDATITKKPGDLSDLDGYIVANFSEPRPYQTYAVDVRKAGWRNLKHIIFGNNDSEGEGVLVNVWQPIPEQESQLYRELDLLIGGAIEESSRTGVKHLAMPVLTGNKSPSEHFYNQLAETLKRIDQKKLPNRTTIYAYQSENYQQGLSTLNEALKK